METGTMLSPQPICFPFFPAFSRITKNSLTFMVAGAAWTVDPPTPENAKTTMRIDKTTKRHRLDMLRAFFTLRCVGC